MLFTITLHTFLIIVLVILVFILVMMGLATLYQKLFVTKKRRRRYTMYDDSTISYSMRAPLIRSHSMGPGSTGVPNGGAAGPPTEEKKSSNPALAFFNNRSISLVDMYTDMGEPTEKCGELNFGLEYDFATQTLKLKIIQARDLAAKDTNGLSDPYVRVTLLPDKKHRLETKIKRRTLNPRWNETFYFEGFPINKLQARVLHLHCYDYDRFSRDDSIGEIHLPLCQVDFTSKPQYWKPLYPPIKEKLGELLVSLTYHPSKNTLSIVILKAKNLKAKDINGKSDPYVKVWLMFGDKRVEKKKTPVYKCNLNPIFNATFEFDVPWEQIRDCALDVQVMDFDTVGRNELIGKLCLGSKNGSGPSETKQWQDMIAKPRQAVVVWHRLKPGD
ncbi:synaptotagmin-7-like isoform X2 [Tigriopus californicus]|uniref:synaptotagmin-7-like isoform X2 n=1 Tax=Tigriopus californicus TaxID=6832 RepID=UPI0027DA2B7A|nr:synaptotagmin-7-like isoform X2 [Tigriopus californicus]